MNDDIDFGFDQGPHVERRNDPPRIRGKASNVKRRHLVSLLRSGTGDRARDIAEHLVTRCVGRRLAKRHAQVISWWSFWSEASCGEFNAKLVARWKHQASWRNDY